MAFTNFLPLRITQTILAIIILGLTAYVAKAWSWTWSPSSDDFLVFTSVWTLLVLIYLTIAPGRFPRAAHPRAILILEILTTIFWFAGFIAFAVFIGRRGCGTTWGPCRAAEAAVVFSAIEWLLFMVTAWLSHRHDNQMRGTLDTKRGPAMNTGTAPVV